MDIKEMEILVSLRELPKIFVGLIYFVTSEEKKSSK
jgi:hypothetical protein